MHASAILFSKCYFCIYVWHIRTYRHWIPQWMPIRACNEARLLVSIGIILSLLAAADIAIFLHTYAAVANNIKPVFLL
jgi:hypothetical protein